MPAGWYPDPSGRHEHRYWDGTRWTEHVASHGRPGTDPDLTSAPPPTVNRATEKVVRDVARAGATGTGAPVGQVVQQNVFGKIRFALESPDGQVLGSINAENWRAWNFSIRDAGETEVARITKTWEGLAKTMFTTADNYVVQLHRPLDEPLRSLVVASALSVDTALKQDKRGFG